MPNLHKKVLYLLFFFHHDEFKFMLVQGYVLLFMGNTHVKYFNLKLWIDCLTFSYGSKLVDSVSFCACIQNIWVWEQRESNFYLLMGSLY